MDKKAGHPRFYEILDTMAELHSKKNHDYAAGGIQGALGNFERVSQITKLYPGFDWSTPFGVAMHYMLKQLDATMILYAQKRDSITGEPIPERLKDIATYTVIMMILAEEEKAKHTKVEAPWWGHRCHNCGNKWRGFLTEDNYCERCPKCESGLTTCMLEPFKDVE